MSSTSDSNAVGNFEQPVLAIFDPLAFGAVRTAIEGAFSSSRLVDFLRSLELKKIRIRSFETVLKDGLLGASTASEYAKLDNGDQGQIREFYLARLEQVSPELRQRFFKLYSYY